MIYRPERYIFIHIPRTGGMAIKREVLRQAAESEAMDELLFNTTNTPFSVRRHATLRELNEADFPIHCQPVITIMRNPFEIIASTWRLICRDRRGQKRCHCRTWRSMLQTYQDGSFDRLVFEHFAYLKVPGGFFNHFCEVNLSHPVLTFRFETLDQDWGQLSQLLELTGPRPHGNSAVGAASDFWTTETINCVAHYCRDDLERFGYQSPEECYSPSVALR